MTEDPWVQTVLAAQRWLHHYSPGTREQYRIALQSLTDYGRRHDVAPIDMTNEHLRGWLDELRTIGNQASTRGPVPLSDAGLTRMSAAANSFLRRASSAQQPRAREVRTRGAQSAKKEHLTPEQVRRVFVEAEVEGLHVEVLVRLLLAGMRVSEAIRVTRDDLTEDGVEVKDGRTASSHRVVPLPPETHRVLRRRPAGAPLVDGLGKSNGRRHAHLVISQIGDRIGVKLRPQMLTAYAISDMLARGVPLAKVQRIAGHRSLSSTVRYQRQSEGDLDAAGTSLLAERVGLDETTARRCIAALRAEGFLAH